MGLTQPASLKFTNGHHRNGRSTKMRGKMCGRKQQSSELAAGQKTPSFCPLVRLENTRFLYGGSK